MLAQTATALGALRVDCGCGRGSMNAWRTGLLASILCILILIPAVFTIATTIRAPEKAELSVVAVVTPQIPRPTPSPKVKPTQKPKPKPALRPVPLPQTTTN